jgi:hypothetical protein
MKNISNLIRALFIALVSSIFILSCTSDEQKHTQAPAIAPQNKNDEPKEDNQLSDCEYIQQLHPIDSASVIRYIYRFWNNANCSAFGEAYGAGAFIPLNKEEISRLIPAPVQIAPPDTGIAIYPCINSLSNSPLYFAIKGAIVCPGTQNNNLPIASDDELVGSTFVFEPVSPGNRTPGLIAEYLAEIRLPNYVLNGNPKLPNPRDAGSHNDYYKKEHSFNTNYADKGFGYMKKSHLIELFEQENNIAGICLFFGFDSDSANEKIRLIIIAVDSTGKLLLDSSHCSLEKSWPPIQSQTTPAAICKVAQ